jgi:predicted HTH domain antitoxin
MGLCRHAGQRGFIPRGSVVFRQVYREGVMSQITLTISDESLKALKLTPEQFGAELRLAGAIKLYELGRLSSGAAADAAGIPKAVFLTKLGDYGVDTFDLTEEELGQETRLG